MMTFFHIREVEAENRKLREALELSVSVLQQLIDPDRFSTPAGIVWREAVEAETKARRALRSTGGNAS